MKRISLLLWIVCAALCTLGHGQQTEIPSIKDRILHHRAANAMTTPAGSMNSYLAAQPQDTSKLSYYEASIQFSDNSNPNGTWYYGYTKKLGGRFTLYTISGVSGVGDGWFGYHIGETPLLVAQPDLSGTRLLTLHPGPVGELSVARWVAPSTGTYDFLGFFYGLDPEYGSDVYVLKNNATVYHDTVAGYQDEKDFSLVFSLQEGDKIDFVVAVTPGDPLGGAFTGMGVAITPQRFNFKTVQFPGVPNTMLWGINNLGDIAGRYKTSDGVRHGFVQRSGVFTTIDYPGLYTYATGINDFGWVVGYAFDKNSSNFRGYLWHNNNFTDVVVPGAADTTPFDINDLGYISGQYDTSDGSTYGFVRDPGGNYFTYEVTGSSPGTTYADGMNIWGQLVGEYADPDFHYHGYLRNPNGNFTTIDFPPNLDCGLNSINLSGNMVGGYCDLGGPASCQAFLHNGSDFVPFWMPITPYTGEYTQANKINDRGVVVGYYFGYDNIYHGFIATPVSH